MATCARNGTNRGISFIEVLIGAAIISLFFTGIIAGFQLSIKMIGHVRAQSGALALGNERIEYLRSLPYDDVGTQGGIPSGTIAQNESVVLNGITYSRRTLVQYVDAPEDGSGVLDSNGIMADYKRAKVELTWSMRGESKSLALVTNLIPRGIETVSGGGTLVINVFDSNAAPVSGAEVRVINASTSPAIDVMVYTNASGTAMFPGAPASGGYQLIATKTGYSTDQTYGASGMNPNPNPPHVSVVLGDVSTVNFSIDRVSRLVVQTVSPPTLTHDDDSFADQSGIASSTNVVAAVDSLGLASSSGLYLPEGSMITATIEPSTLLSWTEASWSAGVPLQTAVSVSVYTDDGSGTLGLISDGELPGNSTGFTSSPIDLSSLSPVTHPRLALGFRLLSLDGLDTPVLLDRRLSYMAADTPIPGVAFSLTGVKNIGTTGGGLPIKKYDTLHQTNALGLWDTSALEWDLYDIVIDGAAEGYDIADACDSVPLSLAPDSAATTTLVLVPHTARSLLVRVETGAGEAIEGASVHLTRTGVDEVSLSSACGYAHFSGLPSATDYVIEVTATGYLDETFSDVEVSGTARLDAALTEN